MTERFKNIEFLRFVFALIICCMHAAMITVYENDFFDSLKKNLADGYLAVDFFFIVSGFFFAKTLKINLSVSDFIKKKILRLWPVLAFSVLCVFLLSWWGSKSFNFYNNVFILLFLNCIGITLNEGGGVTWYVSSLFFSFLFLFYLKKTVADNVFYLIVAIIITISYTALITVGGGNLNLTVQMISNFLCAGLLRGLGGMGLGILLFQWISNNQKKIETTFKNRLIYTLAEAVILGWIISGLAFHRLSYNNNFIFIIAFVVLIWLFLVKRGYLSNLLDNSFSEKIGRYSYSLFLMHLVVIEFWLSIYWFRNNIPTHPAANFLLLIGLCLLVSIFVYHIIEKQGKYRIYFCMLFSVIVMIPRLFYLDNPLELNETYRFNHLIPNIQIKGKSGIEWATWSFGKETTLKFSVKKAEPLKAIFTVMPYVNEKNKFQGVQVFVNNQKMAYWQFEYMKQEPETFINLPKAKNYKIKFIYDHPVSPRELGLAPDDRELALALISMKIEKNIN